MASKFSVVVPLFNEEDNVERLLGLLSESLEENALVSQYEILCVDDGSTDATLELLRKFSTGHTRIVALPRNAGQSTALAAGMQAARFETIGLIDGDLQTTPDDFEALLRVLADGYDFVSGVRVNRCDSLAKRLSSRIANGLRQKVLGDPFNDIGCPLKVFRKKCVAGLMLFDSFHRYLPYLVRLQGFRVAAVPVRHFPRVAGTTKYGLFDRVWIGLQSLYVVSWLGRKYISRELGAESGERGASAKQ